MWSKRLCIPCCVKSNRSGFPGPKALKTFSAISGGKSKIGLFGSKYLGN